MFVRILGVELGTTLLYDVRRSGIFAIFFNVQALLYCSHGGLKGNFPYGYILQPISLLWAFRIVRVYFIHRICWALFCLTFMR